MSDFENKVLAALERIAVAMERQASAVEKSVSLRAGPGAGPELTDADLDSDLIKNDPLIKKDPPRWTGPKFQGRKMSAATPAYLKELSGFYEWCADKEASDPEKKKYAPLSRMNARRARAWARRKEAGWEPPAGSTWGSPPPPSTTTTTPSTGSSWGAPPSPPATAAPTTKASEDKGYPSGWDEDDDEVPLPQ